MSKTVEFNDDVVALQKKIAPGFSEFSKFAQMAIREEINRRLLAQGGSK